MRKVTIELSTKQLAATFEAVSALRKHFEKRGYDAEAAELREVEAVLKGPRPVPPRPQAQPAPVSVWP